jgi:hypothetical protein
MPLQHDGKFRNRKLTAPSGRYGDVVSGLWAKRGISDMERKKSRRPVLLLPVSTYSYKDMFICSEGL